MKKNEIIELNGKEYTLELNRDSFIQIDRACNYQKSMQTIYSGLYNFYDEQEIGDDFNPEILAISDEEIEKKVQEKEDALHKLVERAYFIWLYPNHQLKFSEVQELLKPYLDDEEKVKDLMEKTGKYLAECIEIRQQYNEERKNLKAQANKKQ